MPTPDPTWTFSNLTPNSSSSYDVYVHVSGSPGNYDVNGAEVAWAPDATGPSLGTAWQLLGSVTLTSASASIMYMGCGEFGTADEVAVLERSSTSTYDLQGDVTSTTDALGHVTTYTTGTAMPPPALANRRAPRPSRRPSAPPRSPSATLAAAVPEACPMP